MGEKTTSVVATTCQALLWKLLSVWIPIVWLITYYLSPSPKISLGLQSQADEWLAKVMTFSRAILSYFRTCSCNPQSFLQQHSFDGLSRIDLPVIGNISTYEGCRQCRMLSSHLECIGCGIWGLAWSSDSLTSRHDRQSDCYVSSSKTSHFYKSWHHALASCHWQSEHLLEGLWTEPQWTMNGWSVELEISHPMVNAIKNDDINSM